MKFTKEKILLVLNIIGIVLSSYITLAMADVNKSPIGFIMILASILSIYLTKRYFVISFILTVLVYLIFFIAIYWIFYVIPHALDSWNVPFKDL